VGTDAAHNVFLAFSVLCGHKNNAPLDNLTSYRNTSLTNRVNVILKIDPVFEK